MCKTVHDCCWEGQGMLLVDKQPSNNQNKEEKRPVHHGSNLKGVNVVDSTLPIKFRQVCVFLDDELVFVS